MLKGDTVRLQPWFIIRRVSCLYIVAYTSGCHKDYKGDWLHRGLLHSFWRWEILVWNLVFISPAGQFGCRYVMPIATRHSQRSLKVEGGVSFFFQMESAQPVPFLPHTQAVSMAGSLFVNYVFMVWISRIPSFPGGSDSKESACNMGDMGLIPGLGRSPGEGNGYPLQYSGLENSMDKGAWRATAHGVAKSWTWLRDFHTSRISLLLQMHTLLKLSLKNDAFFVWSLLISWYYFGACSSHLISRLATLLTGLPFLSLSLLLLT